MKGLYAAMPALALPQMLRAQGSPGYDLNAAAADGFTLFGTGISAGQFFVAILAGLLLAYCFQWLLTNLSVAIGASALQGVTDPRKREEARRQAREKELKEAREGRHEAKDFDKDEGGWEDTAVKVESGLGIWAMATSSIALFLGCWLAVELIRLQGNVEAVILGLVIWSAFLGTMMWIESAAASSLLGLMTRTVKSGVGAALSPVKAAASAIGNGHAASGQRKETVKTAEEVAAAVRKELFPQEEAEFQEVGPSLKDKIRGYVQASVKPKVMDMASIGSQVKALLTDPELVEMAKRGELQNIDRQHFAEIVSGRTDLDKDQVEKLTETLHSTWGRFLGESAPAPAGVDSPDYVPGTALAATGSSPSSSQSGILARYKGFKEFLRSTGREELSPERLEQEVKTLVVDPKLGMSQLREHLKQLDRESLVQALGQRKDMTPEEANRIADQIELARARALSSKEQAEHRAQEVRDRYLARIRDYVYSLNRPELDYEGFEGDFRKLLDDPKAGYAALKTRLAGLDRETLIAVLSSRENVSREDAERMVAKGEAAKARLETASAKVDEVKGQARAGMDRIVDRVLEAKESVLERARQVEEETRRRLELAKQTSLEQAEAARKVTATAAWWLLAIAVVSGIAAALGGLTAAGT